MNESGLKTLESNGPVKEAERLTLTLDIVIATRNRPEPLRQCLEAINRQTLLPGKVIVIDSSEAVTSRDVVGSLKPTLRYGCLHRRAHIASAAQQRNIGADLCSADLVLFLDDDAYAEPQFIAEIVHVFQTSDNRLAGVSGTITNQTYSNPTGLNRLVLGVCIGRFRGSFAGKVFGPAVNFLPEDGHAKLTEVDWLPSGCTAYRRDIFLAYRFEETFAGYSFAEDLHLSTRIRGKYGLASTTRARIFHADLGKDTHRDWVALGKSQVLNRHLIMTSVLQKNSVIDYLRLLGYEIVYCALTFMAAGLSFRRLSTLGKLLRGKFSGFWKIWNSRNSIKSQESVGDKSTFDA